MKILLIGANGYLGARLFFDLRSHFEVVGTYHHNQFSKTFIHLDVTDKHEVENVFLEQKPDVIVHVSNYSSSRNAENNEENFTKLNLEATETIQNAANKIGAKVIFISSYAALTPNDIYGELKLKSEQAVSKVTAGYLIIRPSLILGFSPNTQNDRPFNRIIKHIGAGTTAEFDTSWKFQPTYIGHISQIIMTVINKEIWNKTVHVFCPSVQTQYTVAQDILRPFDVEVKPIDKKMKLELQEKDERELTDLGFPTCSYETMIQNIHDELQNRADFIL